jgi:hypothetical protein
MGRQPARHQFGRSLWKRIRIGRGSSCIHPCSGHSNRKGNLTAPGTGRSTRLAPHFGHFGSAVIVSRLSHSESCALAEGLGMEAREFVVLYAKGDFDWFAANLAVFNVGLAADGQVQHHRNFFPAIWTGECVFH